MKKRMISLLRKIENRVFYAIFQTTRVTNDNYGWKPSSSITKEDTEKEKKHSKSTKK